MYDPSTHREPPRYIPGLPDNQGNNGRLDNTSDTELGQRSNNGNKINLTYINVCGLKSKLLNPDFENLIKSYDVLVFVESKLDK